jgi:hypothetical protein
MPEPRPIQSARPASREDPIAPRILVLAQGNDKVGVTRVQRAGDRHSRSKRRQPRGKRLTRAQRRRAKINALLTGRIPVPQ